MWTVIALAIRAAMAWIKWRLSPSEHEKGRRYGQMEVSNKALKNALNISRDVNRRRRDLRSATRDELRERAKTSRPDK